MEDLSGQLHTSQSEPVLCPVSVPLLSAEHQSLLLLATFDQAQRVWHVGSS